MQSPLSHIINSKVTLDHLSNYAIQQQRIVIVYDLWGRFWNI